MAVELSEVNEAPSTINTPQTGAPNDSATVRQGGGTVTFTLFKNVSETDCLTLPQGGYPAGTVIHTSGALSVPNSAPFTVRTSNTTAVTSSAATVDTYRWKAAHSGTSAFNAVTICKELTTITIDNGTQVTNLPVERSRPEGGWGAPLPLSLRGSNPSDGTLDATSGPLLTMTITTTLPSPADAVMRTRRAS